MSKPELLNNTDTPLHLKSYLSPLLLFFSTEDRLLPLLPLGIFMALTPTWETLTQAPCL